MIKASGYWSGWGKYSFCTKSCGTGKQKRRRNCLSQEFSFLDGTKCNGPSLELRMCNTNACSGKYNFILSNAIVFETFLFQNKLRFYSLNYKMFDT